MGTLYSVSSTDGSITTAGAITSTSTTHGFLPPTLTTVQRDALGTPATGTATVVDWTMLSLATLTVAGHILTEGTDWFAATSNQLTADSLTSAINTLTEVTANDGAGSTTTITITAVVVVGSNALTLATSDNTNLHISGGTLTGEVDPSNGLNIYNTTTSKDEFFNGSIWGPISSGGTPGGSNGEIQYNNSNAFGGTANITTDGNILTFTSLTNGLLTFATGTSSQIVFVDTSHSNIGTDTLGNELDINSVTGTHFSTFNSGGEVVITDNGTDTQMAIGGFPAIPDASAVLDLSSSGNNLGFLLPRMTQAQRDAIGTAATGNATVVDYTMLSGAILTVAGHALTEGMDWTAATDNDTTAASLASAVNALSEVNATSSTNVVNIVGAIVVGSGTITLATSDAVNLTISGSTLTGEVDPATGLEIYNTDSNELEFYNGSVWFPINNPAGSNTQIQFNNNGVVGASANFTWTDSSKELSIAGNTFAYPGTNDFEVAAVGDIYINSNGGVSSETFGLVAPNSNVPTPTVAYSFANFGGPGVSISDYLFQAPDVTAVLDLQSITKGFLLPRMTATQRDNITTPADGLQIYNTDTHEINYYDSNAAAWQKVSHTAA